MEYTNYGVIGGVNSEEHLENEKAELNSHNEWEQALRKYLLNGGKLTGGEPAVKSVKNNKEQKQISLKQRAAIRR